MRNIFSILMASLLFLSVGAQARNSALILGNDENSVSLSLGGKLGMGGYDQGKDDHGMGMKDLSGHIGIAHYVGNDFEYGLDVFAGWGSGFRGKLFGHKGANDGFLASGNLFGRFMPKMTETVRFGGMIEIGYSRLMGNGNKNFNDGFSFGDMSFNVGPTFSHQATNMFTWGFGLTYGMSDMRFGVKDGLPDAATKMLKKYSNLHNIRLPINFLVDASESVGVAFGTAIGWRYLEGHKFYHGLYYDVYVDAVIKF